MYGFWPSPPFSKVGQDRSNPFHVLNHSLLLPLPSHFDFLPSSSIFKDLYGYIGLIPTIQGNLSKRAGDVLTGMKKLLIPKEGFWFQKRITFRDTKDTSSPGMKSSWLLKHLRQNVHLLNVKIMWIGEKGNSDFKNALR